MSRPGLVSTLQSAVDESSDRQIGNRRGRNYAERGLRGPSQSLPCGQHLLGLQLDPRTETLRMSIADRKDFYHQLKVGDRKASKNTVFPPLTVDELRGTSAYADLLARRLRAPRGRSAGDHLHSLTDQEKPRPLLVDPPDAEKLYVCFASVFQGGHLGVATCGHSRLLKEHGRLSPGSEVRADADGPLFEGLVIDDYYAISIEEQRRPPLLITCMVWLPGYPFHGSGSKVSGAAPHRNFLHRSTARASFQQTSH